MKKIKKVKPSAQLDGDSAELLALLENGAELKTIAEPRREKRKLQQSAAAYFQKNARLSLRLSQVDLDNLKQMAAGEGLPYQSFISSMLHKLTTGRLVEKH